jgi:hypothetical protein
LWNELGEKGWPLWESFSARWLKNNEKGGKAIKDAWESFRRPRGARQQVKLGSLIWFLRQQQPDWQIPEEHKRPSEVRTMCMADIEEEDTLWYCRNRLAAGEHTTFIGPLGRAKSQLALRYGAAFTLGGAWPWEEGTAPIGNIVLMLSEDSIGKTVKRRLRRMGADMKRVFFITGTVSDAKGEHAFSFEGDAQALDRKLAEIGDVRLIIVDAIGDFLIKPGSRVSINSPEVRAILGQIKPVLEKHGTAMLSINHLNKPKEAKQSASDRAMGNRGLVAHPRLAFFIGDNERAKQDDDKARGITVRALFIADKNNLGPLAPGRSYRVEKFDVAPERPDGDPGFVFESGMVNMTSDELMNDSPEEHLGSRSSECEAWLRGTLAEGERPSTEVREEGKVAGFSVKQIYAAAKALGVKVSGRGGARRGSAMWALPPDDPPFEV